MGCHSKIITSVTAKVSHVKMWRLFSRCEVAPSFSPARYDVRDKEQDWIMAY
jgi:hypothetical protein